MEADFSGYATKAGLKCTDGRTIMPDAFKHQDTLKVPLVWQHGHTDPENVLGHAILENRADGVYAYGFFNKSAKAVHTHGLIEHKDITMMSIWANDLIERAGRVLHGAIREVSLVLSGANPGALIENVTIRHSDDDDTLADDEAIIYTGLSFEHAATGGKPAATSQAADDGSDDGSDDTIQDIYDSMTEPQKQVLHYMIGEAIASAGGSDSVAQDNMSENDDATDQDVYDAMSDKQKQLLHFMIGEALESSNLNNQDNVDENDPKGNSMKHNVFENDGKNAGSVLSHDDMKGIVASAVKSGGSLKAAVEEYALSHGIENINLLFPEPTALDAVPEWLTRRIMWVDMLLQATRKSPFSRIKTLSADITMDDARARGYIKGNFKKEEFFSIAKRVTTPTTIYKKQKLDRDDMIDITDFDVVAWLKTELRLMIDEELARAILIGDGRDISSDDKINEGNIRPIATDHDLYATKISVNVDDAGSSAMEVIEAIIMNRSLYKGSGTPSFFTTETWIAKFLLLKDSTGRRIYKSIDEVALDLRVDKLIPVEVMEQMPSVIGIIVNPVDYVIGADKGGEINMFDFFDIDYNQYKYMIETRACGALVKLKSALVILRVAGALVVVSPATPSFNKSTGVLTIVDEVGVVYKNGTTIVNAAGSPYPPIAAGAEITIDATPAAGYYFPTSHNDSWLFKRNV